MSEPAAATAGDPSRRAFDLRIRPTEARIDGHALMHNLREARRGLLARLGGGPEVGIPGLCSHFANADLRDPTATRLALDLFVEGRRALLDAGQPLQLSHLANSAATLDLPSSHHDMVRPG